METIALRTKVLGARAPGASHVRAGVPCQDSFAWRMSDDLLVLAVADGLGSAARSDLGADAAVRAAVDASGGDIVERVVAARAGLEALGPEMREVACTLLVVEMRGGALRAAHVGDGSCVARTPEGLVVVSAPAESEYVNEVAPLTADDWPDLIRVSSLEDVDAVALFTDGCQRAAIGPDGAPSPRFFEPLFSFAFEEGASEAEVEALLRGAKMAEHSDDDKTLLVAVSARA